MEKQNRVWTDNDGIIRLELIRTVTDKEIWLMFKDLEEELKKSSSLAKILINITTTTVIRSSLFRKTTAEKIKKITVNPGFEKAAIYGGNIITKTIASFILKASDSKNIKIFNSEKEALTWLKKN